MKKKKTNKKKKDEVKENIFSKYPLVWMMVVIVVVFIFFMAVLDPIDAVPPRVSKECCDDWCAKGEMECHRYTKEYVMCKFSEDKAKEGISPVIQFWVYNTTELCYSDMEVLTGVKKVPFEGEGEVKGEVSVSIE